MELKRIIENAEKEVEFNAKISDLSMELKGRKLIVNLNKRKSVKLLKN